MLKKLECALTVLSIFMAAGVVVSKNVYAECKEGEERTTTTGAVFTCDTSHASFGEAWRDPHGLVWGDIAKKVDGSVRYMVQSSEYLRSLGWSLPEGIGAKEYCQSIGARLPSQEEFAMLREYMGARSGMPEGYSPQVLPNLDEMFWSSSVFSDNIYYAIGFYGSDGNVFFFSRSDTFSVRCVVDH